MDKLRRVIIGLTVLTAVLCCGLREAEAVQVDLTDSATGSEYFASVLTEPGSLYRFSFSYWIDTDFQAGPGEATNHDTFAYALLGSHDNYVDLASLSSGTYTTFFDNFQSVDIVGATPLTPISQIVTADQFLFPYFSVADGNPDFYAEVHIEYTLDRVESTPVPEPSTVALLGAGILGVWGFCRRRKKQLLD